MYPYFFSLTVKILAEPKINITNSLCNLIKLVTGHGQLLQNQVSYCKTKMTEQVLDIASCEMANW